MRALSAPAYRTTLGAVRDFAARIAELPAEQKAGAISATERYFYDVLGRFGYAEEDCKQWTFMMMSALRQIVSEYPEADAMFVTVGAPLGPSNAIPT